MKIFILFGVNMKRKIEQCPELIRLICIFPIVQVKKCTGAVYWKFLLKAML